MYVFYLIAMQRILSDVHGVAAYVGNLDPAQAEWLLRLIASMGVSLAYTTMAITDPRNRPLHAALAICAALDLLAVCWGQCPAITALLADIPAHVRAEAARAGRILW
jgi:hypothetical protein